MIAHKNGKIINVRTAYQGMREVNAGSARLAISPSTRPRVAANAIVRGFERRFLNLPDLAL